MKRFIFALGLVSVALNFSACQKDLQETTVENSGEKPGEVKFELFANTVNVKTTNDGLNTKWAADDKIGVFHSAPEGVVSDGEFGLADAETGRFTGTVAGELTADTYSWYAVYPYSASASSLSSVPLSLGAKTQTQKGAGSKAHLCGASLPLYGTAADVDAGTSVSIAMKNLCAVAKVVVKNNSGTTINVANVSLTAPEAIVGDFTANFTGETPSFTASSSSSSTAMLNVDGGASLANGESAEFFIALKPFSAAASSLTLSVNGYRKTPTSSATQVFTAGSIKPLVFNFDKQIPTPESYGFTDVSANFVKEGQSFIKVYSADAITGVPISILSTNWDGDDYNKAANAAWTLYGLENNVYEWEIWDGTTGSWPYGDANFEDGIFSFPGDWASDRQTMNCHGKIAIVTLDLGCINADLKADISAPASVSSAVVTSGWVKAADKSSKLDYLVKDNGSIVNYPTNIQDGSNTIACVQKYRASLIVDGGEVSFATAGEKSDGFYSVPFQSSKPDVDAALASATEKIDAPDLAWVSGWGVRDGKAMGRLDLVNNDSAQFISGEGVLGPGWASNFYKVHNLVGLTYDGKLAFMINANGADWVGVDNGADFYHYYPGNNWFNFRGYSLKQMFWLAHRLGWKEAAVLGNQFGYTESTFCPSLLVNGKSVIDGMTPTATTYVLAVDAK